MPRTLSHGLPLHHRSISLAQRLSLWISVARQRARLAELEPHLLKDIGISAELAREEADRPFWDAPTTWRK